MRLISQLPTKQKLVVSEDRLNALKTYLTEEIEDAFSSRNPLDLEWRDLLRLYEGVPKNPVRNFPIENAPNTEITLGAIASDSIYAQMIDLVYTTSPLVTVRATNATFNDHAKAMQRFVNIVATQEADVRSSSEHTALDDVQLGTGVYYIPWVEYVKKTKSSKVTRRGPRIFSIPPEDFLVPGGSYENPQLTPWAAIRTWLTKSDLNGRAKRSKWNIGGFKTAGNVDWVRSRRETLGHTFPQSRRMAEIYEILDIYVYFDIDGDGLDEDLLVVYDRTSRDIGLIVYNPFDTRPIELCRYQLRAHLMYGLGVMEMIKPYQEETSEIHNARTLNMLLANCRFYVALDGTIHETTKIWPSKIQFVQGSTDNLKPFPMADIYPSAPQAQAITTSLAERRVGVNEMSMPRPSQVLGSRTPGITALSLLQQVNRRFTPAFDAYKGATGGAIIQCLYRYQERLLSGDRQVEKHINDLLGSKDGRFVIDALKDDNFDEGYKVELTVSSASVNRDADRQNAIMLVNLLATYYQRTLELVAIAANPQTPEPVRDVARKIANSAGEIIDRTIRTFDQIRDPEAFIIDVNAELDKIEGVGQEGLQGLAQILQLAGQQGRAEFPPTGTG